MSLLDSFEKALAAFRSSSGLTARELDEMEVTSFTDLQKTLFQMHKAQAQSRTMKHMKRLQPFLDAMKQYGKVLDVFVNTSSLVAFIWGPVKFLLLTVPNVADALNTLLEGYSAIGEHMPLLMQYRRLFEDNQYMRSALALIFEDILEFHLNAVRLFKQRTWKQVFHATQRTLTTRVEETTRSIRRHKAVIEAQVNIIQYEEYQSSHALMKAEFASLHAAERDRKRTRVYNWLGLTIDSELRHQEIKKDRFGDTGQWLLQDDRFRDWFSPTKCVDPLLWLHGMPGAGKTVLASRVVEEIRALAGVVDVRFYCRDTDEQRGGDLTLLKSIIAQVLAVNDPVLDYIYEEMSKSGEATLASSELAKKLTELSLKSCGKAYIVIDGLDEYSRDNRKSITSWFKNLIHGIDPRETGFLRCLFVSQDDGVGRKDLSALAQIHVTGNENSEDIRAFCAHWHRMIEAKFGSITSPVHDVANVVSARAQGMFLYAKLVTWNLYEQTSRADFEAEMNPDRIPQGLDQAYDRIIDRLLGPTTPPSRRKSIKRLLGWLVCAKRPLAWQEIQAAVAVDLLTGAHSTKHQFREDCKDLCASLVDIDPDQSVRLIHSTTREYLVRRKFVVVLEAEHDLSMICLTYLNMQEFESGRSDDEIQMNHLEGFYAFFDYAVCFWPLHIESTCREMERCNTDLIDALSECFEIFLDIHWTPTSDVEAVPTRLKEHMTILQTYSWHDAACSALATAKSWLRPSGKSLSNEPALQIRQRVSPVRTVLENMVSSSALDGSQMQSIKLHYGRNHFKCERMHCQFFHVGFLTKGQRDQHAAKHARSFTCLCEGCPYEIFGFATREGLQRHGIEQHGISSDTATLDFPDQAMATARSEHQGSPRFRCFACQKSFSRAYNLRSHLRTHTSDRPFACTLCSKKFARKNDLRRHQNLHTDEFRFVCGGELNSNPGEQWGCGRRFKRADALALHYQSEVGRACIASSKAKQVAVEALQELQKDTTNSTSVSRVSSPLLNALLTLPSFGELPLPESSDDLTLPDRDWSGFEDTTWDELAHEA